MRLNLPIASSYHSIDRPVMVQVMKAVHRGLSLPTDIYFSFKGDSSQVYTFQSENGHLRMTSVDGGRFGSGSRLEVECKEIYDSEVFNHMQTTYHNNHAPLLDFPSLGVQLIPHYVQCKLQFTFTYKTESHEEAMMFRSEVIRLVSMMQITELISLRYNIHPDKDHCQLLCHLYQLQKSHNEVKRCYKDWLRSGCLDDNLNDITNVKGESPRIAFTEEQINAVGIYQITEVPEKSKRETQDGKEFSFDYVVYYQRPQLLELIYPLMIHNQPVDMRWIPSFTELHPSYYAKKKTYHDIFTYMRDYYPYMMGLGTTYTERFGITIPFYDDWLPDYDGYNYSGGMLNRMTSMYIELIQLKPKEKDEDWYIGGLSNMTPYLEFGPGTLRLMREQHMHLNHFRYFPVCFVVYMDDIVIPPEFVYVTKELDVYVKEVYPLNMKRQVRLQFLIQHNWTPVENKIFQLLTHYPDFIEEYCNSRGIQQHVLTEWFNQIRKEHASLKFIDEQDRLEFIKRQYRHVINSLGGMLHYEKSAQWTKYRDQLFYQSYDKLDKSDDPIDILFKQWLQSNQLTDGYRKHHDNLEYKLRVITEFQHNLLESLKQYDKQDTNEEDFHHWYFGRLDVVRLKGLLIEGIHDENHLNDYALDREMRTVCCSWVTAHTMNSQ